MKHVEASDWQCENEQSEVRALESAARWSWAQWTWLAGGMLIMQHEDLNESGETSEAKESCCTRMAASNAIAATHQSTEH